MEKNNNPIIDIEEIKIPSIGLFLTKKLPFKVGNILHDENEWYTLEEAMKDWSNLLLDHILNKVAEEAEMKVHVSSGYQGNSEYTTQEPINYHENCGGSRYYTDNTVEIDKESILKLKEVIKQNLGI